MLENCDTLNYMPLTEEGIQPSSAKMTPLKHEDERKNKVFQIDDYFEEFLTNKMSGRRERLTKYYTSMRPVPTAIIEFIIKHLVEEYPHEFYLNAVDNQIELDCERTGDYLVFDKDYNLSRASTSPYLGFDYVDAFDALAMQVPEDMVIGRIEDGKDFASNIHLCHANGWTAEWAIGKDFGWIHKDVPRINEMIPRPANLVKGLVRLPQTMERVGAISFRTDAELNRHEDNPQPEPWKLGKNLIMRFERQTITGFKKDNAFLFTIRTYFVDASAPENREIVIKAFENDHSMAYSKSFLDKNKEEAIKWLKGLRDGQ